MMDRRGFLKALSAAGIALAAPAQLVALAPRIERESVKRKTVAHDLGAKIGLCAEITRRNVRYRHAIALPIELWEQSSPEQREELWRTTEVRLFEYADRVKP